MILALLMVVFGFAGIFSGMGLANSFPRLAAFAVFRAIFTMIAGVLLMGPKIGWYLAMIAIGLNLIGATLALVLAIGSAQAVDGLGPLVLGALLNAFLAVAALMILLNPKARASHGIGSSQGLEAEYA